MTRLFARVVPVLLLAPLAAQAAATAPQKITYEQVFGGEPRLDFRGMAPSVRWAPDGEHLVIGGSKEWKHPRTGATVTPPVANDDKPAAREGRRRPPRTAGGNKIMQASPTGTHDSFVRGNNLVIVDRASELEWAVSEDGSDNLLYGILDWVYQEEV